jgi:hypothetical protein
MPRKGPAPKRPLVVDPVYSSPLVTQLVMRFRRREIPSRFPGPFWNKFVTLDHDPMYVVKGQLT